MRKTRLLLVYLLVTVIFTAAAAAETYRVGPGEKYSKVSQVAAGLTPGDVVEITGDIEGGFTLTQSGFFDQPIIIRGLTRVENGRIIRPKLTIPATAKNGIVCQGDWNTLEGLEITAEKPGQGPRTAITASCHGLTVRNCHLRGNRSGLQGWHDEKTGDILIEFCEFESNGGGSRGSVYVRSKRPGAKAVIRHCYFHNEVGGSFIKSLHPRNVIENNWFESEFFSTLKIVSNHEYTYGRETPKNLRPMHTDIVGNVFIQGWSPASLYDILQLGGEGQQSPGTEGDFHIAHNLFVITRDDAVAIRVHGNVDRLLLYNNIFLPLGVTPARLYERGNVFESQATDAFTKRRGHGDPMMIGANNWIAERVSEVPSELEGSILAKNPGFVDLVNLDFHPAKGSGLLGAAKTPLPQGRLGDLLPKYEPTRGIPVDLKAPARAQVETPAIGPFEAPGP